jgi:hypothetical protein
MNTEPITPLLEQMTDGYCHWQEGDRRRRKHHNTVAVVSALLLAVAVNTAVFAFPVRYSSFDGSYAPKVVPVIDRMIQHQ